MLAVALWAAWAAHKTAVIEEESEHKDLLTAVGLPRKQKDFAKVLGVSPRTLQKYAKKHPGLVRSAQDMGVKRLLGLYRLPALHALGQSASDPSHLHAADRRTYFTITGDLVQKQDITSDGEKLESVSFTAVVEALQKAKELDEQAGED